MSAGRYRNSYFATHDITTVLEESGEDNLEPPQKRRLCVVGSMPADGAIVLNTLNKMHCEVVYSETGAEYAAAESSGGSSSGGAQPTTFLCWRFDDALFRHLHEAGCLIVGPTLVLQCAGDPGVPVVERNRPAYTQSLRGMRFCLSGFAGEEVRRLVDLIHFMRGSARQKFTDKDMLIAGSVECSRYNHASGIDATILSRDFIDYCWSKRDSPDFNPRGVLHAYRLKCFAGLRLCFKPVPAGFDLSKLKALAKENGAKVECHPSEATHIVYPTDELARTNQQSSGIDQRPYHVGVEWVSRCIRIGRKAEEYAGLQQQQQQLQQQQPTAHPSTSLSSSAGASLMLSSSMSPAKRSSLAALFSGADSASTAGPRRRSALNPIADPANQLQQQQQLQQAASANPANAIASTSTGSIRPTSHSSHSKSSLDNLENTISGPLERSADNLDAGGSVRETKRFKVFCELLDTEQNYVDILELIINNFRAPLEERLGDLVSRRDLNTLFCRIDPLLHVHVNILRSLQALAGKDFREWKENKLVGQVYATPKEALLDRYMSYMNSYDQAMASLTALANDPKAAAFLRDLECQPACKKLSLKDMLIRPVQRLPSVILLLKELRKATDKSNPDYQWLELAITSVDEVLMRSNQKRQQTDMYTTFMHECNDIEGIPPAYFASSREFHAKIAVLVLGAGGVYARYKGKYITFFLFNDMVITAKNRQMGLQNGLSNSTQNLNTTTASNMNMSMSMTSRTLCRNHSFLGSFRSPVRKPYKFIEAHRFSSFRLLFHTREKCVFFLKIRDLKADEMCAFQVVEEVPPRIALRFFSDLAHFINANSTRQIDLEDAIVLLDPSNRSGCYLDPEDLDFMRKMIAMATHQDVTSALRRSHSQLRRAVSSVSVHLQRMTSRSRLNDSVSVYPR